MVISSMCIICSVLLIGNKAFSMENNEGTYSATELAEQFDTNTSFVEIEEEINAYISSTGLNVQKDTQEYIDFLYSILYGEIENIDELTNRYFAAYASVYVSKSQDIPYQAQTRSGNSTTYDIVMEGTIKETKEENESKRNALSRAVVPRASYNVAEAQRYAERYALSWNYVFGKFTSDCTNFASQIVNAAGMPMVAGEWQYNGNQLAKWRWNLAADFTDYWALERGHNGGNYMSRSTVNSVANPGDFLAYMSFDTDAVWHVAFVQSKSNGQIYISQHTTDRFNEKWNNISIGANNSYIVLDF